MENEAFERSLRAVRGEKQDVKASGPLSKFRKIGDLFICWEFTFELGFYVTMGVLAASATISSFIKGEFDQLGEFVIGAAIFIAVICFIRWVLADARKSSKALAQQRRRESEYHNEGIDKAVTAQPLSPES